MRRRDLSRVKAVNMKSVRHGHTVTVYDDGHAKNDPSKPGQGRQQIISMLKKKAPDGGPTFYPASEEDKAGFVIETDKGKVFMSPIEQLVDRKVWGKPEEKRQKPYLEQIREAEAIGLQRARAALKKDGDKIKLREDQLTEQEDRLFGEAHE